MLAVLKMALQGNWHCGCLYVWSAPQAPAGPDQLRAVLGDLSPDPLIASAGQVAQLRLELPVGDGARAAVTVPALRFSPGEALDLLAALPTPAPPGCDVSLACWAVLARFVIRRIARRQFYPAIEQVGERQWIATWRLLLERPHLEQLERLAASLPRVCLSACEEHATSDPHRLVESFLATTADAIIRRDVSNDAFFATVHARAAEAGSPPHVRWLSALLGADRSVGGNESELRELESVVRSWVGRLEEHRGADMQLCFRLIEPQADDDASAAKAPWTVRFELRPIDGQEQWIDAATLWAEADAGGVLGRSLRHRRQRLLAELARAVEAFPPLERALAEGQPAQLHISAVEAGTFIRRWAAELRDRSFGVFLPPWAEQRQLDLGLLLDLRPVEDMDLPAPPRGGSATSAGLGLQALLEFDWRVAVGGLQLSQQELSALVEQHSGLVRYQGRWLQIDPDAAGKAMQFLRTSGRGRMTLGQAIRAALGISTSESGLPVRGLSGTSWVADLLDQMPSRRLERLTQPPGFVGTLRPYQLRGMEWLVFLQRLGIGACLADDMGLGKTIQLIALLLHERREGVAAGPTLLFAPTSVVGNWQRELERFAPCLRAMVHHGMDRLRGEAFARAAAQHDVVITSYALAHRDLEDLRRPAWYRVVLDEAQKIKNPYAAATLAVRSIPAAQHVALTGTPIENHLPELWSIMESLNPGLLGSAGEFRERFVVPIEKLADRDRAVQLRGLIRPFVLRRTKSDPQVAADLPEKMEMRVYCNLTAEQAALYQRITSGMLEQVEGAEGIRRRGLILAGLTRLKQVCDHPELVDGMSAGEAAPGHAPSLDGRSGKCERLIEMLEEVLEEGDAALIFTQFRQMGHVLEQLLTQRLRVPMLFLHGGTPRRRREQMIDQFQKPGSDVRIFILSLRAGGLGLNLTAANHVFHFDRWWNPAVEAQATDRAHRIGQTRKVQVHKFVCAGTLEERIDRLLSEKIALADSIVATGEEWLTNLSTEELKNYLALSRDAVAEY